MSNTVTRKKKFFGTSYSAVTRSKQICCCEICEHARLTITRNQSEKVKRGRPQLKEVGPKEIKRRCNDCLSEIRQGKKHTCTVSERISNLSNLLHDDSSASRSGEAVVSSFLHKKIDETGKTTIQLRNRRGRSSVFQKER